MSELDDLYAARAAKRAELQRAAQIAGILNAQRAMAGDGLAIWTEPLPAPVEEICQRFKGIFEHRMLETCEHLDLTKPEPAVWIGRWPEELRCWGCRMLTVHALNVFEKSTRHDNGHCDRCRKRGGKTTQGTIARGLVLLLIELCDPCLNSEGAPSGEAPAEEPDRRDDKNGIRYGQG